MERIIGGFRKSVKQSSRCTKIRDFFAGHWPNLAVGTRRKRSAGAAISPSLLLTSSSSSYHRDRAIRIYALVASVCTGCALRTDWQMLRAPSFTITRHTLYGGGPALLGRIRPRFAPRPKGSATAGGRRSSSVMMIGPASLCAPPVVGVPCR